MLRAIAKRIGKPVVEGPGSFDPRAKERNV